MDLTTLSLAAAAQFLDQQSVSAAELTEFFLDRIAALNPQLNAFLVVMAESAREQARRADGERARGAGRGPLHGIPLALKDLFDVRGTITTAGSLILRDNIAAEDAEVVTRLRQSGAILVGKTNLHEFAFGATNENPHYGDAKNPWALEHATGGSSGGSGAAVAARLCLGALGTDTGGSIRIPASLCGITGIKPTYGRVSLRGVIPLSWSNDHAGPMAQTAHDCALLLNVLAGYDPRDPKSANVPVPDFTATLNHSLRGHTFATARGYFAEGVDPEVLEAVEQAAHALEQLGAARVERPLDFAFDMYDVNRVMLRTDAWAYHRENLERRASEYGPDVGMRLRNGEKVSGADYALARRRQAELVRALELWFDDVDWLVVPTTRVPAPPRGLDAVQMASELTAFTAPFNATGFPAISLPCGFTRSGLPIGLQLVGRRWDEGTLLQAAHQYQLATDWHMQMPQL